MSVITNPVAVRELYNELAERDVAIPCFCAENQRTVEAILQGVTRVAEEMGVDDLPVFIAFTATYPGRQNSVNWTSTSDPICGARLCLSAVRVLAGDDGPFRKLRVFTHLDHGQPDTDSALLTECLDPFSCVMFDASMVPFDENIRRTAEYVARYSDLVTIEGAVDEIVSSGGQPQDSLCTVERAERFVRETGVDLIVPNVGTEHRATQEEAKYHGDLAHAISESVGKILCLHGTSSLSGEDVARLNRDGIVKVNIWTRLALVGGQAVARHVLRDLGNVLGAEEIASLVNEGLLGSAFDDPARIERLWGGALGPKLNSVAETARRRVWVDDVSSVVGEYLFAFGYRHYGNA